MTESTHAIIFHAYVNKFNCSKHDVTLASSSQATVHMCSDYSSSIMRSFCLMWANLEEIGPENIPANFLWVHLNNPYSINILEPQTRWHSPEYGIPGAVL